MRRKNFQPRAKPKKPETVKEAAPLLRKYMIGMFDREDGRAADWLLIADTLFQSAFDALGEIPADDRSLKLLRRVHAGAYDRLAAGPGPAPVTRAGQGIGLDPGGPSLDYSDSPGL